jgi:hypothetical protein
MYTKHWHYPQFQVVAEISSIYPKDTEAPPAGVDDMTKLAYLHEPGVLYNLLCRFSLNEIYVSHNQIINFSTYINFSSPYKLQNRIRIN